MNRDMVEKLVKEIGDSMYRVMKDGGDEENARAAIAAGIARGLELMFEEHLNSLVNDINVKSLKNKLDEYRADIQKMLERHNEERAALVERVKLADEQIAQLQQYMHTIHQGLNRAEGRINSGSNTFQTFVRFYQGELHGRWEEHKAPIVSSSGAFLPRMLTEDKFIELFTLCGQEVFNEAMQHEKAELTRLKAAKQVGVVLNMKPRAPDLVDKMQAAVLKVVEGGLKENEGTLKELHEARAQAMEEMKTAGRNDPCPCGSGKKFKHCHGFDQTDPEAG